MKNKYYNEWELDQAINLMEKNPYEAVRKFENYLKKYRKDYNAFAFYINSLVNIKEIDKAKKVLASIENKVVNDSKFINNNRRYKSFKKKILYNKLQLLMFEEKYQEFYDLYNENISMSEELDIGHIMFWCKIKLDKIKKNPRDNYNYLYRQLIEYNTDDLIDHINNHTAFAYDNDINSEYNMFTADFPLLKILNEIKKYIPSDRYLFPGFIDDRYTFKYDGCGKINSKNADYFRVICIHNSDKIITMYPVVNCEEFDYVDLNYMLEKQDMKIKRKSRIDRFNDRYKK